jgi:hypothetical protein
MLKTIKVDFALSFEPSALSYSMLPKQSNWIVNHSAQGGECA